MIINLANLVLKHLIRGYFVFIFQLLRRFHTSRRDSILESFPGTWQPAIGQSIRVREVFWHQAQLHEDRGLIPCYVLVV